MAKGSEIIKCSHNSFHEGEFYCNAGHDIDKCNPKECENYWEELIPISDPVNAQKHYVGKIECIDYLWDKLTPEEFTGFCMGNVLKYCSRWRKKDGVQDLKKAKVYLDWAIENEEKKDGKA